MSEPESKRVEVDDKHDKSVAVPCLTLLIAHRPRHDERSSHKHKKHKDHKDHKHHKSSKHHKHRSTHHSRHRSASGLPL